MPHADLDPSEYLDLALHHIQQNAVRSPVVDWPTVRAEAQRLAQGAVSSSNTYAAIELALHALGDHHSFLQRPGVPHGMTPGGFGLRYVRGQIARIFAGSPAEAAGLRVGDHVTHVNGEPVGVGMNAGLPRQGDVTLHVVPMGSKAPREVRLIRAPFGLGRSPQGRRMGSAAWLDLPNHPRGTTLPDGQTYQDAVQSLIAELDASNPTGWVVDLRLNEGGDMYPMIAGAGPLMGDGQLGAFVRGEETWPWSYAQGAALLGEEVVARVSGEPYSLRDSEVRVAVLLSPVTGSSGEILAISFRGRPNTRLFGEATQGLTSANDCFELPDGAELWLATSYEADRTGRVYEASVELDEVVPTDWAKYLTAGDAPLHAAVAWLEATS